MQLNDVVFVRYEQLPCCIISNRIERRNRHEIALRERTGAWTAAIADRSSARADKVARCSRVFIELGSAAGPITSIRSGRLCVECVRTQHTPAEHLNDTCENS